MLLRLFLSALLLASFSCRTSKPSPVFGGGSEHFFAHRWALVELDGQPVPPARRNAEAHLLFFPQNRVAGSTGCNRLNGTFELSQGTIKFAPLSTTRRACPDAAAETRFVNTLGRVSGYWIDASDLRFYEGSTVVARLRATPAQSSN